MGSCIVRASAARKGFARARDGKQQVHLTGAVGHIPCLGGQVARHVLVSPQRD